MEQWERSEVHEVGIGWAVGCSRRGASHIRSGKPCQDAHSILLGSLSGYPHLIAAVADGHGDKRHDFSQYGSSLAVKVAVDELFAFYSLFGFEKSLISLKNTFKADFPRRLGRRWRDSVLEDAKSRLGENPDNLINGNEIFSRYGTTLLVALAIPDVFLIGQIGDGNILVLRRDESLEVIFDKDDSLVGTETYGLSSSESHKLWHTAALDRSGGEILVMATDGIADSFQNSTEFHKYIKNMQKILKEHGLKKGATWLPGWLDDLSQKGSGDDMTLTLVCSDAFEGESSNYPKDSEARHDSTDH
jgi:serine/threonine protein phosphatase PrpC